MNHRRIATRTLLSATIWLACAPILALECYTPEQWQHKRPPATMDANGDFVQDTIDQGGSTPISVILNLREAPQLADLARFETLGSVALRGDYLSFVVLRDVDPATVAGIAMDPLVAFVEADNPIRPMLATSRNAVGADQTETAYGLTGAGVNIAIVDSGVDDGVHVSLPPTAYVGGLDCNGCVCLVSGAFCETTADCPAPGDTCSCSCESGDPCLSTADCPVAPGGAPPNECRSEAVCTERNPDDTVGHGTAVASVALGRGGGDCPGCRGVAPGAGLVDVKVFDSERAATKSGILFALEELMKHREAWDVHVVNLSFSDCTPSDGTDVLSQLVNRAADMGLAVVAAAGNYSTCGIGFPQPGFVPAPGAADGAISVGAIDERDTADIADDIPVADSVRGPRAGDDDLDAADEQKPDVSAPGTGILAASPDTSVGYGVGSGTSFSAAHVSGCIATYGEENGVDGRASLVWANDVVEGTAYDLTAPGWDPETGVGGASCINGNNRLVLQLETDLGFQISGWKSPAVFVADEKLMPGLPNEIFAEVTNFGPNVAEAFRVELGVYNFGHSPLDYPVCTIEVPAGLAPGNSTTVGCPFVPDASGAPPGSIHTSLEANVVYDLDTDFANQTARRNTQVIQVFGPPVFRVEVSNPTQLQLDVTFNDQWVCECAPPGSGVFQCPCPGWVFQNDEPVIPLGPDDCPVTTELRLEPVDPAQAERRAAVDLAVIGIDPGAQEYPLTGMTIEAELACETHQLLWVGPDDFSWQPPIFPVCPDLFDLARGVLPIQPLPGDPSGNFDAAGCLMNSQPQNQFFDPQVPPPGQGFFYVVSTDAPPDKPGSWNTGRQRGDRDRSLQACR